MLNTVSARKLQREYKKVIEEANKIKQPLILMSNNRPQGAVIGLDLLEQFQLQALLKKALKESKEGKTKRISTERELKEDLKELEKYV